MMNVYVEVNDLTNNIVHLDKLDFVGYEVETGVFVKYGDEEATGMLHCRPEGDVVCFHRYCQDAIIKICLHRGISFRFV